MRDAGRVENGPSLSEFACQPIAVAGVRTDVQQRMGGIQSHGALLRTQPIAVPRRVLQPSWRRSPARLGCHGSELHLQGTSTWRSALMRSVQSRLTPPRSCRLGYYVRDLPGHALQVSGERFRRRRPHVDCALLGRVRRLSMHGRRLVLLSRLFERLRGALCRITQNRFLLFVSLVVSAPAFPTPSPRQCLGECPSRAPPR